LGSQLAASRGHRFRSLHQGEAIVAYLDALLSAYHAELTNGSNLDVETARAALAEATSAEERGRRLAAVAMALVRESLIRSGSFLPPANRPPIGTTSVRD
jgi:hypothetical protein